MKSEEDKTSFNRPNSTNSGILDPLNQLIQIINTNDMRERERERERWVFDLVSLCVTDWVGGRRRRGLSATTSFRKKTVM